MTLTPIERIATALERIADALDDKHTQKLFLAKEETQFPWHEVGIRLRNSERNSRSGEDPLTTAERLIRIGRRNIIKGEWPNTGRISVENEIDPIMERLGFSEQWLNT